MENKATRPTIPEWLEIRGFEMFRALEAKVDDFMLFLGRCVWGPGQLQSELDKASDTPVALRAT